MIQVRGIEKRFQRHPVLDGVDLSVLAGDRIALIGSNGAGKTSLIRCILGEYSFSGVLTVVGLDPRRDRVAVLDRVGFVPQLPPPLKVRVEELVALTAGLMRVPAEEIHQVARGLGLDLSQHRKQIFFKLSGGMKQKLLIAIALARRPRILILDEPAANLDPEARETFFAQLAAMPKETVMLLSSHRVDEISQLVNRVVEMDQGKVVVDRVLSTPVVGEG
ncbi:MAG: ABC transporter ATP-binding protein [Magnetococcales bacterium]|nr:ABC transporter ATP-binding protein [Magnetococcales bacterium]